MRFADRGRRTGNLVPLRLEAGRESEGRKTEDRRQRSDVRGKRRTTGLRPLEDRELRSLEVGGRKGKRRKKDEGRRTRDDGGQKIRN